MGGAPMNSLNIGAILLFAYVAVFLEACPWGIRSWLSTQVDVLPPLMVYCGLSTNVTTVTLTAVLGGLLFDSLSANPLGITVFPLFGIGLLVCKTRDLV